MGEASGMNNNADLLYNKKIAVLAAALMVLFACLFGVWKPLHKMQREVLDLFWGSKNIGVSINEDLKTKTGYASNLMVLAKKYNVDSGRLETCIKSVDEDTTPSGKLLANQDLNKAIDEIHDLLLTDSVNPAMSEVDKKALYTAYTRVTSQEDIIARSVDKYTSAAEHYNHELGGFPANIFGRIVNLRPIKTI